MMVRTTTKRKSESALPPSKHRKNSSSPEPRKSSDGLFEQDAPFAAKHVKKCARKSEPPLKTRVDEEYDEDVGRTESQTFLALVEFESKKKRKTNADHSAYMGKFERDVKGGEGKLKLALADGEEKSTKSDTQFLESFRIAYGAARAYTTTMEQDQAAASDQAPRFAAMYKKGKELTNTAFALVAKFEEVAQRIENLDATTSIENEWVDQDAVMVSLLQEGKRVSVEKYRRILAAGKEPVHEDADPTEEGNAAIDGLLFFAEKDKVEGSWGKVAKKQARALNKLVKTLSV